MPIATIGANGFFIEILSSHLSCMIPKLVPRVCRVVWYQSLEVYIRKLCMVVSAIVKHLKEAAGDWDNTTDGWIVVNFWNNDFALNQFWFFVECERERMNLHKTWLSPSMSFNWIGTARGLERKRMIREIYRDRERKLDTWRG